MADNPLGKQVSYPESYDPGLLVPIPRSINRQALGIGETLPFTGADVWNVWECSWLDAQGKPVSVILRLAIPCTSPNIVESKSLKLYFNSLNQHRFESEAEAVATILNDITGVIGEDIELALVTLDSFVLHSEPVSGRCLDEIELEVTATEPDPSLLKVDEEALPVSEVVHTNLFRSLCPITSQPDWATVTISYQGKPIDPAGLLHYLVSYRRHNDYHEHCTERVFTDILAACRPEALTVEASFLRRGGIDINPIRSTEPAGDYLDFPRYLRQ